MRSKAKFKPTSVRSIGILPTVRTGHSLTLNARYGTSSAIDETGEQSAYFYKGGKLAGISQLSTGREGLNTPIGHFAIQQKDVNHVSSKFGDYVDAGDNVVKPNVELGVDARPPGTHFKGAPMPYFMR